MNFFDNVDHLWSVCPIPLGWWTVPTTQELFHRYVCGFDVGCCLHYPKNLSLISASCITTGHTKAEASNGREEILCSLLSVCLGHCSMARNGVLHAHVALTLYPQKLHKRKYFAKTYLMIVYSLFYAPSTQKMDLDEVHVLRSGAWGHAHHNYTTIIT